MSEFDKIHNREFDRLNKPRTVEQPVFEPGDRVEYCDDEATVVHNYGSTGTVRFDDGSTMRWYWNFQDTPVTLVRKAGGSK